MFVLKKRYREAEKVIAELREECKEMREHNKTLCNRNEELREDLREYEILYPFTMGQTVYDVQLRSAKGRFTKTKASREHSLINEVVVDRKNYFNLVDRYNAEDVFLTREDAEEKINTVCVE